MNKNLNNLEYVKELINYHDAYFKHYMYYDVKKKCFAKDVDVSRPVDFIKFDDIKRRATCSLAK